MEGFKKTGNQNNSSYAPPFQEKDLKDIDSEYSHQKLVNYLFDHEVDRGLGCIFGSLIGDTLGAYCQFQKNITQDLLNEAMKMNGGGVFNLRMGQFTDDSEMTYHLLDGLSNFDPKFKVQNQKYFLLSKIGLGYIEWAESHPFDIGITCSKGIDVLRKHKNQLKSKNQFKDFNDNKQFKDLEEEFFNIYEEIKEVNSQSQSNGSLMRITPIPFFGRIVSRTLTSSENIQNLNKFIYELTQSMNAYILDEVKLIHSNINIINSSQIWVQTLQRLISRKNNSQLPQIYDKISIIAKKKIPDWWKEVEAEQIMPANQKIGWAKIAWSYGMRILKEASKIKQPSHLDQFFFRDKIKYVIGKGGDTDTNAAIVGGLIGSIIGFKKLPRDYIRKMMSLRFPEKRTHRSDRRNLYEPRNMLAIGFRIMKKVFGSGNIPPNQKL